MTIQDLKKNNLILFEVISGSKSFGLDTPASDTDIKGVFYLPKEKFFGLDYIPQVSNETNDEVYYELGRFVELLLKNNPNILEILATPEDCVSYRHPLMENLKLEDFLSKLCKDSFAGYAMTQIKKARGLKKKIVNPMEKERKSLLEFCFILEGYDSVPLVKWLEANQLDQDQCGLMNMPHSKNMFALFYDAGATLGYRGIVKTNESNELQLSSIPKGEKERAYLSCNLEGYSVYCKEYREYWDWVVKRNDDRYNMNQQHGKNYDSKNMMHTVRLLQSAEQILTEGKLNIRVGNRGELLSIKAGEMEYDELLQKAEDLIRTIEAAYPDSQLQDFPDYDKGTQTLIAMREILYK
ncbi:nucleotidyltransferase domain-containing protein [Flavobacterium amniphilum]|uniref:DNA polymerase beta superfamily protein n=1 Tax=Flavobacterium amniphilum TaxID=1834035 RepID=UPI00202A9F4E|nr:nucleotidyltransferase domain-containing protein [Flavobacterium amniphilum]MCL9804422.1 nucleotidyltransferase domain-containing protein [Flavobacterium amniphilum]